MMQRLIAACVSSSLVVWIAGCGGSTPAPDESSPAVPTAASTADGHADHEPGVHGGEIGANLAKLSAEDREAAEKQQTCPVSGEELGAMGVPLKVDVKGTAVWICCDGCREKLLGDPDIYLAKLK